MFHLFLKNETISAFENETLDRVLADYFNHYVSENYEPVIERIEVCDKNGNTIEIILGDLVYDKLVEQIRNHRKAVEEESAGLLQSQKEALPNNWRI